MKQFWDSRYSDEEYAYGSQPNAFFKSTLDRLGVKGKILLPADGEGRNGIYAASQGWDVTSFDISSEGKKKAERLAKINNVTINYIVGSWHEMIFPLESFDTIALIFAHLPSNQVANFHRFIGSLLKPGGHIIFEGFSKDHLNYNERTPDAGGPKKKSMLFSKEDISLHFKNYEDIILEQSEIDLEEGQYHNGKSSVIRFIGRKPFGN